jgi:hypothetical protein
MKVRVLGGLISAVLTPLLLTAGHSGDSTGPNITAAATVTKLGTEANAG